MTWSKGKYGLVVKAHGLPRGLYVDFDSNIGEWIIAMAMPTHHKMYSAVTLEVEASGATIETAVKRFGREHAKMVAFLESI